MDRSDKDDRINLIGIGESRVREDHRRNAYEVLNDKVSHIDRHGPGTSEVDDLRSAFDAFLKAEIIHPYESTVWNNLIQKYEADVLDFREQPEEPSTPTSPPKSNLKDGKRMS